MKFLFLVLFINFSLYSKFEDGSNLTTDDLGSKLLQVLKSNDEAQFNKLVATKIELEELIEKTTLSEIMKKELKESLFFDFDKRNLDLNAAFKEINKELNCKKCKKEIKIKGIEFDINVLKNFEIELGTLRIKYKCKKKEHVIQGKMIKTLYGWKILEKLVILYR